jgi:uncharacterized protein with NRDE domain
MCLILFAIDTHPDYPLVLAANRDEFFDRPTAPCAAWQDEKGILAGRDLREGGTWLGVNHAGLLAAITNYREPVPALSEAETISRGHLVSGFLLEGAPDARAYLTAVAGNAHHYRGFNLLLREKTGGLFWFSNRASRIHTISPGVHGLSNHLLDTPWPKVRRGRDRLASVLAHPGKPDIESLFAMLKDRYMPPEEELPDTGIGEEWERRLAPLFVCSPIYGTRSSTIVTVNHRGGIRLYERTYHYKEGIPAGEDTLSFHVRAPE